MSGVMENVYGSFSNLKTSIWQMIFTTIKPAYDTAAAAASLTTGLQLNKDNTYTTDAFGLGILDMDTDSDSVFTRVPTIGYELDTIGGSRPPYALGSGDGANWEYHKVCLQCIPAINIATDPNATQSASKLAIMILQTAVWNAVGRTYSFPIVDSAGTRASSLYPQVGYAEILKPTQPRRPAWKDSLVIDRRDFNVEFDFRMPIQTFDGL